jgi:hypothetical protein
LSLPKKINASLKSADKEYVRNFSKHLPFGSDVKVKNPVPEEQVFNVRINHLKTDREVKLFRH